MAGKLLELAIAIKGKLDKAYTEAMQKAISEAGNLQRRLGDVNRAMQGQDKLAQKMGDLKGIQANIQRFRELKQSVASAGQELSQAQATASRYAAVLRRSQAETARLKTEHDALKAALKASKGQIPKAEYERLSAVVKSTAAALKNSEAATKAAGRAFEQAKSNAAGLKAQLAGQQAELQRIRSSMAAAGYSAQNLAQNEIRLRQEIEQTRRAMQLASEEQERAAARQRNRDAHTQAQGELFSATSNWQQGLSTVQSVAAPFKEAIDNAMTFEHAMSKVKALTQSGLIREGDLETVNANMQKLEAQARQLGATTQFTMTQAAEAMGYLGMAGWKTEQIYGTMPGMLDLAAGAGTDLARTADIVSDNMTAMGVPVEKAGHFMDVYAYALTNANVNLESLGETMKYAAPVAAAFGASLEDTAAMTMMMGNAGIKGSMAGTALRMGLLRLAGPPKKASKEMEALGISVSDATAMAMESQAEMQRLGISIDENAPPMEKMSNIIKQLQGKMQGLSREEKLASVGAIFGANAASGWINIIEQGPEAFDKYRDALQNCDGYAKQFAHIMNDDARGAMIALDSATDAVVNSIGTAFLPYVRQAAEALAPIATGMAEWIAKNKEVVLVLSLLAAAIAAVVMTALTVNVVVATWGLLGTTYTLVAQSAMVLAARQRIVTAATLIQAAANRVLATSMFALRNPVSAVTTLFAGMPAKMAGMRAAMAGIPAMVSGGFAAIPGMVSGAAASFAGLAAAAAPVILAVLAIIAVVAILAANWDKVKETATIVFNHISGTVAAWKAKLAQSFDEALAKITAVWNSITGQTMQSSELIGAIINNIGFVIGAAFDIAAGIVGTAISVIINWVASMAQIIGGIINIVVGLFTGDWSRAWQGAGQAAEGAMGATIGTLKTMAEGIGSIFDTLLGKSDEVQKKAELAQQSQGAQAAIANQASMPDGYLESQQQAAAAAQQTASATAEASANAQALATNTGEAGAQAQQAQGYMEQLQQVMQQTPQAAQTAFAGMGDQSAAAAQAVGTNLQQIPTQAQATFQQLPPIAQQGTDGIANEWSQLATKCQPGGEAFVQAANQWGQQAYESIANWSAQMAQTVIEKLSSAWSQISAQFSAGLNVNVTTSGAGVAANAEGGIYKKGAFLTTFAEQSAEAAIPLDGSSRAVSLWRQAGEMLGVLPKTMPTTAESAPDMPAPTPIVETAKPTPMDWLSGGINKLIATGGEMARSLLPMKQDISLPPIMDMVGALPPEIGTIAEIAMPPTEADMAAAPVALEPTGGGDMHFEYHAPSITINGNADGGTVSQIEDVLAKAKAEWMREVERKFGSMYSNMRHNERRTSFA